MVHHSTILNQIASFIHRHDFEKLAQTYHGGQKFRSFNRWSQFMAITIAQLIGRRSLRDTVSNIAVKGSNLYHLGMRPTSRATLARVNEQQPNDLYQELFVKLLKQCEAESPKHRFKFKGKIYLLDATLINLCLAVFPWATYRKTKGAMKLYFGIDADGYLSVFMNMTNGNIYDLEWAKQLDIPSGSCVVFDRGYTDYTWYYELDRSNITFVTRLKSNSKAYKFGNHRKPDTVDALSDYKVKLPAHKGTLRQINYRDPETGNEYRFLTNLKKLKASEVAGIYKERWQIELFFKWIKQNLKLNLFWGTSGNAVTTKLWIALCVYLLLSFFKFLAIFRGSICKILRLLQLNLFEKRPLSDLLKPPNKVHKAHISPQLLLWNQL